MFMSLPLVLGGYGRNMFVNLGYALGNSAVFYGVGLFCQYLGSNGVLAPALAAWLPLFFFAHAGDLSMGPDPDLTMGCVEVHAAEPGGRLGRRLGAKPSLP